MPQDSRGPQGTDRIEIVIGPGGAGLSKEDWEWFKRQIETSRQPVSDYRFAPPRLYTIGQRGYEVQPATSEKPAPSAPRDLSGLWVLAGVAACLLHGQIRKWARSREAERG
jgi:hypothetical protein